MPLQLSLLGYVNRDTLDEIAQLQLNPEEQIQLVHSLTTPQVFYHLRVNLTKITKKEFIERLRAQHADIIDIPQLPETVGIRVEPGSIPPPCDKVVYAQKYAAESVSMGAHLYLPGVGPNSHVLEGKKVEIRETTRKIHVSTGLTRMSLRKPPSTTGIAVENQFSLFKMWQFHLSQEFTSGLFEDQSLPPVAAAHVLMNEYQPGLRILDACAAPGGKSTAFAQIGKMQFGTWPEVIAVDRSQNRLARIEEKVHRLDLEGIHPICIKLERIHERLPEWKEQADLVFIDPPCSTLGARPKLFIDTPANHYQSFAENQFRLLQHAWELVKPGGILVYSTCSITARENEENVSRLLDTFDATILPAGIEIGHAGLQLDTLSLEESKRMRRFWPQLDDSIGYFIAKFRRNS